MPGPAIKTDLFTARQRFQSNESNCEKTMAQFDSTHFVLQSNCRHHDMNSKSGRLFQKGWARRILKVVAVLVIVSILGVGVLIGALWLEHRSRLTLPTPTGPLGVGRVVLDWTDDVAVDRLAPGPGDKTRVSGLDLVPVGAWAAN